MTAVTASWWAWVQGELDERGWSAWRLAKEMGVGVATVTRWESLREPPRPETLRRLADALGVPMVDVLVGVGILRPDEVETPGFQAAIRHDPRLDPVARKALKAVYDAVVLTD